MSKKSRFFEAKIVRAIQKDIPWSLYLFIVTIGYLLLSLSGVHGSSLNILTGENNSILIGVDRPIRSDEYLRSTPFELNRIFFQTSSGVSQFSKSSINEPGNGLYEILRPERFFLSIFLSGSQLFAALWWVPHLLLFLGVPIFLRSIKLQTKFAIPITIILAFSPSVVWWSNYIAGIVGRVALASGLIILSIKKGKASKLLLGFFGTYLLSGSFVEYAPWVIVVVIFFASIGLLEFFGREVRPTSTIIGMTLGLVPLGFFIIEKVSIFLTMAQTIYPGTRRFEGGAINIFNWAFSAPLQWGLLKPEVGILASNHSELSLGFLIFLVPAIFLIMQKIYSKKISFKILIFSQIYLFLLAWSFIPIPKVGVNPLELVSPGRALTVTTTLAPLFFAIVLAYRNEDAGLSRKTKERFNYEDKSMQVVLLSTLSFYLTYSAVLTLKNSVAPFSIPIAALTALAIAIAIGFLINNNNKSILYGLWIFSTISFLLGVAVNPVVKGVENLYKLNISQVLGSNDSKKSWGSNSIYIDALLTLNGKNQISGQQLNGPESEMWELIDPTKSYVDIWNVGASYVQLTFDQSKAAPTISRLSGDQILISINPCSEFAKKIDLGFIVSVAELSNKCLASMPIKQASYLGNTLRIYKIQP
jgi:hypothetical protein